MPLIPHCAHEPLPLAAPSVKARRSNSLLLLRRVCDILFILAFQHSHPAPRGFIPFSKLTNETSLMLLHATQQICVCGRVLVLWFLYRSVHGKDRRLFRKAQVCECVLGARMEGRERLHASDLETPVTHRLSHCRRAGLDFTL